MFGGLAFLIGGNMAIAASGQGGVLVRTDPDESEALVASTDAHPMEMRGREMRGWLRGAAPRRGPARARARGGGRGPPHAPRWGRGGGVWGGGRRVAAPHRGTAREPARWVETGTTYARSLPAKSSS